jgi:3-deoxy-manno-octulosonate cytidylyltransferase (CMP-KDO synthetase)
MVRWVYEAARRVLPRVIVATDDERIARCVRGFGGEAVMTSRRCRSGTDRVWEVARRIPARLYVNVQGDEPLMSSRTLARVVALHRDAGLEMGTAATRLADEEAWKNPNVVKVVTDLSGRALYFSRAPIPYPRGGGALLSRSKPAVWKHLGVYSYSRNLLRRFVGWRPTFLETTEMLEQLRALENGVVIRVAVTPDDSVGVDRPEDARRVEKILARDR